MKTKFRILISLSFISLLLSCNFANWEIPEKISVKTSANLDLSLMKADLDLSETMAMDQIFTAGMEASTRIYDFNPKKARDTVQSYLIKMPIQEIPVDFKQYFDDTSLADQIKDMSFDQKIEIPALGLSMDEQIVITNVVPLINALVVVEETENDGYNSITFKEGFEEITYRSGSLNVYFDQDVFGDVSLRYNGSEVARAFCFGSDNVSIDLSDKTIYQTGMVLDLPSSADTFSVSADLASIQKKVKKLTLSSPVEQNITSTIPKPEGDPFEECKVKSGKMDIDFVVPEDWDGVTISYDLGFDGNMFDENGEELFSPVSQGSKKTIDLAGTTIKCVDTDVITNFSIIFQDADIEIGTDKSPKLKVESEVTEYEYIALELQDVTPSISENEYVSREIKSLVKAIKFGPSGLTGKYINTLPTGNDITLTADSAFFDISNKSQTLSAATSEPGDIDLISGDGTDAYENEVTFGAMIGEFSSIDFGVAIGLPGATATNPKRLKLSNVVPATEYEIMIELAPAVTWKAITINAYGAQQNGSISTGVSIGQMLEAYADALGPDFADKLSIKSIPMGIYAVKPDLQTFANAKFTGSLKIGYGTVDTDGYSHMDPDTVQDFIDDPAVGMPLVPEMPQFEFEDDKTKKTIISDFSIEDGSSGHIDLAELVNSTKGRSDGGCIMVDYSLRFTNSPDAANGQFFTIEFDDYNNSASSAPTIAIYAFIEIPLEFNVTSDINLSLDDLMSGDPTSGDPNAGDPNAGDPNAADPNATDPNAAAPSDFLGRDGPMAPEEVPEAINALRCTNITFDTKQLPFYSYPSEPSLVVDFDGPNMDAFDEQIMALTTNQKVEIGCDNIPALLTTYPLVPSIKVKIPQGTLSIPRKICFSTVIGIHAEMDPESEITITGGNR